MDPSSAPGDDVIPQTLDELDVDWLSRRLRAVAPGVSVRSVEVVHAADATNFNATLRVVHDAPSLPSTMFLKLPPVDPGRRARLDWASMGRREARFYREVTSGLDLRVPQAFVAELDEATGEFLLLLEHLDGDRTVLPDPTVGVDADLVAAALDDLAAMHVRFEDPLVRRAETPWLRPTDRTSDYGARLLREGIDGGAPLAPEFVRVAEAYIGHRNRLQDAWEVGPTTVLHGDGHIGNVYVDRREGRPRLGFFDWGLMTVGSPLRDVSYLVTMTLDPAVRAHVERDLIEHYLAARRERDGAGLGSDEAWRGHRVQSAYTVVASCQAIALPEDASPRRRAFAEAFVERSTRAVEDLRPLEALDAPG